jgi:hypothetical protein
MGLESTRASTANPAKSLFFFAQQATSSSGCVTAFDELLLAHADSCPSDHVTVITKNSRTLSQVAGPAGPWAMPPETRLPLPTLSLGFVPVLLQHGGLWLRALQNIIDIIN